jgi:hypothetical protein
MRGTERFFLDTPKEATTVVEVLGIREWEGHGFSRATKTRIGSGFSR